MNRLIRSSKFWAAVGSLLACILVAFGVMDEQNADQFASLIIKAIVGLAGIYGLATAAEDVASKLGGGKSSGGPPTTTPLLLLMLLVPVLLVAGPGCSFLAPGTDVRQAAEIGRAHV